MTRTRQLTLAFATARAGFGLALLGPPGWAAERWIGPDARRRPVQVALRGLAARDLLLALGTANAVRRGGSARTWLAAAVAGDLADIGASLAAGDSLPKRSRWGTPALAGTSAAAGIALALADAG
jgi:hypothetical protein